MANNTKMALVAFLLVAVLMASAAPATNAFCFPDCYDRCSNGRIGDVACSTMCAQACIVPKIAPDGTDLSKLNPGGN